MLDAIPTISIPAAAATVRVQPGRKIEGGGKLTQHALDVTITLGGQNVLDLTVGEATVGAAAVNCGGVADLALQCTTRRIVLIDVLQSKGKVRLFGVADRRFTGRRVTIRFTATNKIVARPRRAPDRAVHGHRPAAAEEDPRDQQGALHRPDRQGEELQAQARAADAGVEHEGPRAQGHDHRAGRAPARGAGAAGGRQAPRVVRPLPRDQALHAAARTGASGSRSAGPPSRQAAAYRLQTRVRKFTSNPKTYPTFTLPRYVDLAQ